jgi:hypothetical protein
LIPAAKINEDLSRYLLPEKYHLLQWEKDGSLTVHIDCVRWLRFGQDFRSHKDKDFLYGTPIKVSSLHLGAQPALPHGSQSALPGKIPCNPGMLGIELVNQMHHAV